MFADHADETLAALKAAMAGKGFEAACRGLSLNVSTAITFSVTSLQSDPFPNARALVPEVIRVPAGGLSKPVRLFGGAAIAHVESRTPAESFEAAAAREAVAGQLAQAENAAAFADWVIWNLETRGFTSRRLEYILRSDASEDDAYAGE